MLLKSCRTSLSYKTDDGYSLCITNEIHQASPILRLSRRLFETFLFRLAVGVATVGWWSVKALAVADGFWCFRRDSLRFQVSASVVSRRVHRKIKRCALRLAQTSKRIVEAAVRRGWVIVRTPYDSWAASAAGRTSTLGKFASILHSSTTMSFQQVVDAFRRNSHNVVTLHSIRWPVQYLLEEDTITDIMLLEEEKWVSEVTVVESCILVDTTPQWLLWHETTQGNTSKSLPVAVITRNHLSATHMHAVTSTKYLQEAENADYY